MPAEIVDLTAPVPTFRGPQMAEGLRQYRELQHGLDLQMPDQLLTLDGKVFRKKGYWRAIALAFLVTILVELDERIVLGELEDGTPNYAYRVTCRATLPNGRSVVGDGMCTAAEKTRGKLRATEHNVRSHAHTRAFNRAVSNLVGFGEVSAEEIGDEHQAPVRAKPAATITRQQQKRLFAIAHEVGWSDSELKVFLESHGYASSGDIGAVAYDQIIGLIQQGGDEKADAGPAAD